ncbi:condensation domain-containing protein, partial [Pseudomonas sp. MAFF 302046]
QVAASPIGEPIPDLSWYLLDADLNPVARGCTGELYVGRAGLARGYLNRGDLSATRFIPDPFGGDGGRLYRTGDLARYRADGVIEYIGRIDHQVKIRGFRIELGEIEARLLEQEGVREAVVLAQENLGSQQLVAYIVPTRFRADQQVQAEQRDALKAQLKDNLPDYMVPAHVLFLEQLPLTTNGKLDRKALPAPDAGQLQQQYIAPQTALEQGMAAIWQEVLGIEQVGLSDNFFELGGHSLLATQVVSRVRQALDVDASLRALFETVSLKDFVGSLGRNQTPQTTLTLADRSKALDLSYAQQRQWILWQLEPDSATYNMPTALHLRGQLDVDVLERSFNVLIARHETLRTTFTQQDQRPAQIVHAEMPLTIAQHRLAVGPQGQADIQAFVENQAKKPFDLQTGPLLRVDLLAVAEDEHVLVLTQHHIVSDRWSMQVMVDELIQLYAGFSRDEVVSLPPLAIQYADYAHWQREWMDAGERERQMQYWTQQLGGEQPVLELPTDHPRPAVQSYKGGRFEIPLTPELSAGLKRLAQSEGVTAFMLLLASFQTLLHRYSGQGDIRVGVPIANRNRVEIERLIGFFVNTQVLKAEVSGQIRFVELLQQVKQAAFEAQAYQDLPFEQLVEVLQPERDLSRNPLFQVLFNHQSADANKPDTAYQLPGLQVEGLEWEGHSAQFDLTLETFDGAEGWSAALIFATDLFDASSIERMAGHWLNLLKAIVAQPQQQIGELSMLEAGEIQQALRTWNQTTAHYPNTSPVHQLFEEQAALKPESIALLFGEQQLTYDQLNRRTNQLAHKLIELGVGPEVMVGIAAERSLDMVIGLMAILKAGGAYVPLDPEYPQDRLSYMFEDSGIDLLLTQEPLLSGLPVFGGQTLLLEADVSTYSDANPQIEVLAENLAYVIYTSGSTGKPKGAGNRHIALHNRLAWMQEAYPLDASDTVLQKTPFSFDVSVWEFFWPLMTGARLAIAAPGEHREPEKLIATIQRHQVTTLHFVPSMLQVFIHEPGVERCTHLKQIMCSGEALQVDAQLQVFARLPAAQLYNLYGPTEAAIDVTHWTCVDEGLDSVPIGQPIANLYTHILDTSLNPVPQGA